MALSRILMLFAVILGTSMATAFLGYRYLALAGEYRARNVVHLVSTQNALDRASSTAILRRDDMADIADALRQANRQAAWCIDNLGPLDRMIFGRLGAQPAIDLCASGTAAATAALTLLDRMRDPSIMLSRGPDSAFALRLSLVDRIETLRAQSIAFQPRIDAIEQRLTRVVNIGTLVTGLALGGLFLVLSRKLMRAWRKEAAQRSDLQRISQRFFLALDASCQGIALFDRDQRLITANDRYIRLSNVDPELVRDGMTPKEIMRAALARGHYESAPRSPNNRNRFIEAHFRRLRDQPEGVRLALADDRHVVERVSETALGDMLITRTDVTEFVRNERRQAEHAAHLRAASAEIERRARTDALTGLANRRGLDIALQQDAGRAAAALIRIDLDRFKQVNDVLGHDAGDFVLRTVADILRRHTRPGDFTARIGGDEFVVLCAPGTTLPEAERIAARLLTDILEPVRFGRKRCVYGASFGIAATQPGRTDAAHALRDADFALYRAKQGGRGRIQIFNEAMRHAAGRERALADDFIEALSNGDIVPYFQTQHDARTRALRGVEVLARWHHPSEGILSPSVFLPIARQLGMEADLDATIFRAAVAELDLLKADGIDIPSASFNVSAARVAHPDFLRSVTTIIPQDQDRFVFEILESVSVEDMGEVIRFAVDALKDAGFRIEVDDFGSGHASINSILDIRPDALKIDRNLIRPLGDSARAEQTVGAIVDMARSVNVAVVAEGVDSEEKARILTARGCDRLQGFLFSKPMHAEALAAFMGTAAPQLRTG